MTAVATIPAAARAVHDSGPAARPALPLPAALVLAAAAGGALLLAFPRHNLWWLAPVGVAMLAVAVRHRRVRAGLGLGTVTGLMLFAPLLTWTNMHVGYAPWVLLSLFQAGYIALLGAALVWAGPVADRWPWMWPPIVAVLWTAQEALRDRAPFGGFPWGRLAFSQADAPTVAVAAAGGAPLVTFVVALTGGLLATAAWRLAEHRMRAAAIAAAAAVAATLAGLVVPTATPSGPGVVVAVVQGNVPRLGLDFNAQRRAVLDNHVHATLALADRVRRGELPAPDLVIWPENSSDIDPTVNGDAARAIGQASQAVGVPILVGAVLQGPQEGQSRNAGIVWLPGTGPADVYLKQHPVPFAEYLPLRPLVEPIARAITNKAKLLRTDFVAGTEPGVLAMGPAQVGDVICFEVAYDDVVAGAVRAGAQLLAVQTNNATFDEAEAAQQLAMVRLRAVEHGRDAVMASTVGISGFVTADGGLSQASGFNTDAVMVRELRLSDTTTLATNVGAWPEAALTAAGLAVLVLATMLRRRYRRRSTTDVEDE